MTTSEERIQAIREETERIYQRIARSREESDARIAELKAETEKHRAASARLSEELKQSLKETRDLSKENERRIAELARQAKKQTRRAKEQTRRAKEQTRQIKEHSRQIGSYGDKFGRFTESLAHPSIRRILKERFGAHYEGSYARKTEKHGEVEIDAWGVARNGTAAVYLIEIKSRFRPEHLRQVWRHVEMFRALEPSHRDVPVYPLLAVVDIEKEHRERIWESGIYLIDVADGVFELAEPPAEFEPCGDYGVEDGLQRAVPPDLHLVPNAGWVRLKG